MKNIIEKDGSSTTRNFFKYRSPSDARFSGTQTVRQSHTKNFSDLPFMFGDLQLANRIKSM